MADRMTDEQLRRLTQYVHPDQATDYVRPWMHSMAHELIQLRQLLRDFTDPDECWFDHHGGCQAHGYLSLEPGELCPHAEAKQLIAEWETETDE